MNGFVFNEKAKEIGFRDGDMIVKMDGEEVRELYLDKVRSVEIFRQICDADNVTVLRNGEEVNITIPEGLGLLDMNKPSLFIAARILPVVGKIDSTGAAAKAGILENDRIVSIDGKNIESWTDLTNAMADLKNEGKSTFGIEVQRDSLVKLTATVDSTYLLSIMPVGNDYPIEYVSYSFLKSFPAGVSYAIGVLRGYVGDFQYVFTSEGAKSVGMFASIGSLFPAEWNWHEFWLMTAFLSIVLAFMNILPIPALDGGHALFLLVEMVTGKQPSEKFMERAQMVGMLLLLGLFILATYNDLTRFVF